MGTSQNGLAESFLEKSDQQVAGTKPGPPQCSERMDYPLSLAYLHIKGEHDIWRCAKEPPAVGTCDIAREEKG